MNGSTWNNKEVAVAALLFTVFTPTYNRAHTLGRVYESLARQTQKDFEWLIVDDGSTDDTPELVASWEAKATFPIRYLRQENRGKHVASNRAVREARGELFLFFDSDDRCVPNALERFKHQWDRIPEKDRNGFSTVSALCTDLQGRVIGARYPADIYDVDSVAEQIRMRSGGERWGANRTSILRRYPFPEIPDEKFISEGIVWNRIALGYKTRFFNEALKIVEYRPDGLTASSVRIRANNPVGSRLYYQELIGLPIPEHDRIKALVNYVRFSFHGRISISRILREAAQPAMLLLALPLGFFAYSLDKRQL
jgi:glycosyltransferase involved in cell wall biosynthesis